MSISHIPSSTSNRIGGSYLLVMSITLYFLFDVGNKEGNDLLAALFNIGFLSSIIFTIITTLEIHDPIIVFFAKAQIYGSNNDANSKFIKSYNCSVPLRSPMISDDYNMTISLGILILGTIIGVLGLISTGIDQVFQFVLVELLLFVLFIWFGIKLRKVFLTYVDHLQIISIINFMWEHQLNIDEKVYFSYDADKFSLFEHVEQCEQAVLEKRWDKAQAIMNAIGYQIEISHKYRDHIEEE